METSEKGCGHHTPNPFARDSWANSGGHEICKSQIEDGDVSSIRSPERAAFFSAKGDVFENLHSSCQVWSLARASSNDQDSSNTATDDHAWEKGAAPFRKPYTSSKCRAKNTEFGDTFFPEVFFSTLLLHTVACSLFGVHRQRSPENAWSSHAQRKHSFFKYSVVFVLFC